MKQIVTRNKAKVSYCKKDYSRCLTLKSRLKSIEISLDSVVYRNIMVSLSIHTKFFMLGDVCLLLKEIPTRNWRWKFVPVTGVSLVSPFGMATSTAEYRHSGEGGPQEFGNYVALNFKMFQVKVAIKKPSTYVDGFTERPDCLYIKKSF